MLGYGLANNKRLLIVAGPTGCGKSTFLKTALGNKPSPLAKKILKKAFTRSDFKIQQLYFRRLQKLYEKQEGFEKFVIKYNNFILDVDTTGPKFKKNVQIFTNFFTEFDYITSIQIYTAYDIWLNRILERKIHSPHKGSRSIRRVCTNLFPSSPQKEIVLKKFMNHIMTNGNHFCPIIALTISFALIQS